MGTPDFSVPILQHLVEESTIEVVLVVTQPDRPVGRRRQLTPPPVKQEAVKMNIPVFQPEKLATEYEEVFSYNPDIIITAAYGQLLPNELLEYPKYGCINVHAAVLNEQSGGAPIHYAILEGKKEKGITIMYMVEKLDAGDILMQRSIAIEDHDDVGSLHDKLSQVGAELLLETLPPIFSGTINPIQQNEEKATFAPNIKREQEKIDWTKSNVEVFNHIRGLRPWPVAYTTYEGERMKIWRGEIDQTEYSGKPGEIVRIIDEESFVVVCGNQQAIKITEIQPAGSRSMSVAEYLRGSKERIQVGMIMGED